MRSNGPKPLVRWRGRAHAPVMTELRSHPASSDRHGRPWPRGPLERFREQAGRRASGRVLDIGARRMGDLPDYQHLCHLALAGAAAEVREASLPMQAEKIDAGPEDLPFPDRAFDVVVCRFTLRHAANPARAASEIARVLRRTGQLLFLEVAGGARCPDALTHFRLSGLITHDVDWSRPRAHPRSLLVQGVATHPAPQYAREFAWLLGAPRGGNRDDEESSGLQANT